MSKKFSKDFKNHAINLVLQEGQTKRSVARNLDIGISSLDRWIRLFKQGQLEIADCSKEKENVELKRLRKEIAELKQEREILKKAAAFFAKEQL